MKIVIFGHRGVGKTSFLSRHQLYFPGTPHFDLDEYIEKKIEDSILNYFSNQSEVEFRQLEIKSFNEIYQNNKEFVIAVGGGFDTNALPKDVYKIYLSRVTDKDGRIFFDRPRLDLNKSALDESIDRYVSRQKKFLNNCDEIYFINEGLDQHYLDSNQLNVPIVQIEKLIFSRNFEVNDAYITLAADQIKNFKQVMKNFKKIELRTDLLCAEDIENLINRYPEVQWMISFRRSSMEINLLNKDNVLYWIKLIFQKLGIKKDILRQDSSIQNAFLLDFDLEVYSMLNQKINLDFIFDFENIVISTHIDNLQLAIQCLENFQKTKGLNKQFQYKLCPVVVNFDELKQGFCWQQQDITNRSFLPRTKEFSNSVSENQTISEGRWNWFRLLCKYNQNINFIRNKTNMGDQPHLFEWLSLPKIKSLSWGAVLGSPIYFSRSPIRHLNYINKKKSFFTKIDISEDEFEQNLNWLAELGLKYICITSPLKTKAYKIIEKTNLSKIINSLESINTMIFQEGKFVSTNTDLEGFRKYIINFLGINFEFYKQEEIVVWGGGGTLKMMQEILPNAKYFSSQRGADRVNNGKILNPLPKVVIWAAPRNNNNKFPSNDWPIELVLDLNYTDNSMGREYAQLIKNKNINVKYVSGLEMFDEQALQQQLFWSQYER